MPITIFRNSRIGKKLQLIVALAAAYAFLGGLISLIGWAMDLPRFTDWWGTGIAIKVNTAVAIVAAAISLMAIIHPSGASRRISRLLSIFVSMIGGLTLIEHITGINFGIDTLLFDEPLGAPATSAPGRMGPPAALSLFSLGIGVYCRTLSATRHRVSIGLAIMVVGIGTLSIVGYLYNAEAMYTIPRLTGIAIQTATMLVALAIGLVVSCPQHEPMKTLCEDSGIGLIARRILLVAFAVPIVLGWLRIQGFRAGLYDNAFGTALRSLIEIMLLLSILWWSIQAIRSRESRQHRAEAEQQSSQRRLIRTLENMPDGFVTLDQSGRFNYVNATATQIFQRQRKDLIGAIWWDIFPAIRETALVTELQAVMRDRTSAEVESSDIIVDRECHFCCRIHPDSNGGVSVYLQDITERKLAQDALREADQHKDEFIAVLAHELRNPLAPIRSAAALLNSSDTSKDVLKFSAQIIERQIKHMARLLEDLLDISRISRNRLEIRKELTELKPIIENAIETSLPAIQKANHELLLHFPSEKIFVEGDAVRLAQVFSNLLNNAAQYTLPKGVIQIFMEYDADSVTVRIVDNGMGIDSASIPHVFAMFTQITPMSSGAKAGLGIGLALASKIIELHGGRIEVSSAGLEQGSTFSVYLPRIKHDVITSTDAVETTVLVKKRRLLVVDDLKDNADSLAAFLKNLGHEVEVAYSGRAAIVKAESFHPEIILLDIGMPEMDGLEVCRTIRQHAWGRQIKIVALTGWGQPEDVSQTLNAGFNLHLVKPVNPNDLINLLASIDQNL